MGDALDGFLVALSDDGRVRGWPRSEPTGPSTIWFHGYLAHPGALRSELDLDASASSGAIVEASWRRWGADTAAHVVGEYAAVVVTGSEAVLLGDRMGLLPLYYAPAGDGCVVSTDLGVLVRETAAWRQLDEEYLADVLSGGMHLGARTPYRDVSRLQAGEFGTWNPHGLRVAGGWRPDEEPIDRSLREHEELLRDTVTRAVAGAMGDGATAVELSGGLDTSTVLAVASDLRPVQALSFVLPGSPGSDETPWIREALTTTPVPWHPIDATEHGPFAAGPEFGTFLAAPSRRIINWASGVAEGDAARASGTSIILTGEGGDAVFFAGLLPWYLADLLRTGRAHRLRHESARWSAHSELRRSAAFWLRRAAVDGVRRWRSGRTLTLEPARPLTVAAPWLQRSYVDDLDLADRTQHTTTIRARSVHGQAVLENVLRCVEFARSRRVSPVDGVESRHPLLSPALVDLALRTPWHVAVDPRVDRAVQRYAFAGRVSETVLRRRSKSIADEAILASFDQRPCWREYLCEEPRIVERGYVDADAWAGALRVVGRVGGVARLYSAIQVEVWLRHLRHVGVPVLLTD